jgi:hypothetical protein
MARAMLVLNSPEIRARAANLSLKLPHGSRVEFKAPKRTLPQNARLWVLLTDLSNQLPWHGIKLSPDDWKLVMMDALKREVRMVPNVDGTGFVNLGRSSSDLDVGEMADLQTLIEAFGASHGVVFFDERKA